MAPIIPLYRYCFYLALCLMLPVFTTAECSWSSIYTCPEPCTCRSQGGVIEYADCSELGLTLVPTNLPATLVHLNLSTNSIFQIKYNDFLNCSLVRTIDLSYNQITSLTGPSSLPYTQIDRHTYDTVNQDRNQIDRQTYDTVNQGHTQIDRQTYDTVNSGHNHNARGDQPAKANKTASATRTNGSHRVVRRTVEDTGQRRGSHNVGSLHGLVGLRVLIFKHNSLQDLNANSFAPLPRLTTLDLSYNHIGYIADGTFRGLLSLEILNLQGNVLHPTSSNFSENVFDGLTNLMELKLQNNFPTDLPVKGDDCYPDGALSKLTNLRRLFLDGLYSSPSCVLGHGFQRLSKLNLLDLQIPGDRCWIRNVSRLFFSNISTTSYLTVSLRGCHITNIDEEAFSFVPTLTALDLSFNDNLNFENFEIGSRSLYKTRIKFLDIGRIHRDTLIRVHSPYFIHLKNTSLETLIMKYNQIERFDDLVPVSLPRSLKVWDISNNKINYVKFLLYLIAMENLEVFNMSLQNHYTSVHHNNHSGRKKFFSQTRRHTENETALWKSVVHESDTYYPTHESDTHHAHESSTYPTHESDIYFAHESDTRPTPGSTTHQTPDSDTHHTLESMIHPTPELSTHPTHKSETYHDKNINIANVSSNEWLILISKLCPNYGRGLSIIKNSTFHLWMPDRYNPQGDITRGIEFFHGWNISDKIPLPRNLRKVYASQMKLEYAIPAFEVTNNHVLEVFDFSKNYLSCFDGPMKGMETMRILDLSGNYCPAVSTYFFNYLNDLQELFLSHNSLGHSLANDVSGKTFSTLSKLQILDLSQNFLQTLASNVFDGNILLESILLHHNSIYELEPRFNHLSTLKYLDLSYNNLYSLSQQNMDDLDMIRSTSNVSVSLAHNPLRCDCSTLKFVSWYHRTHVHLNDRASLRCQYIDGQTIPLDDTLSLQQEMYRLCNGPWILTMTLIFCSVTIIIYVVVALMYHYKHFLYFHLYLTKQHMFRLIWQSGNGQSDVFLVFDAQHYRWRRHVLNELIPSLTRAGISYHVTEIGLGIPSAGRPIRQVVQESVYAGRKTLVLLTKDVFVDEENQLAVNMARQVENETHTEVLVFLGAEKLKVRDIPHDIYRLLRNSSIKRYTPSDPRFWRCLCRELKPHSILNNFHGLPEDYA